MEKNKIKVHAIQCKKCGDTIFSRAHRDCRSCSCGAVFIDGGFEYTRIGGNEDDFVDKELEIKATKKELYDDWNLRKDKYGLIKPGE